MTDAADIHARPKIIGARIKRTEDPRLLTGHGSFVDDRQVPGALHVAFRRSEHAHARIVSIDCAAARAAPGVVAVLTADDLARRSMPLLATSRMKGYYATPILPLARGKVRYVGEPVVGVIAREPLSRRGRARADRDRIRAAAARSPIRPRRVQAGAPLLHEEAGTNVLVAASSSAATSMPRSRAAPVRVRGRFRMRRKTAVRDRAARLPRRIRAGRDALTLHSATQVPGIVRDALAEALDLPGHRLRVVAPDVGGGFGGKGSLYPEEIFVCAAARMLGRAVKWTSDRMEDFAGTSQAFDEIVDAELGLDPDGHALGAARRRDRRCRRLLDLSVDRGARAGAGRELPARALSHRALSRPRARRSRPPRRRPDLIAASGGRSRPS